MDKVAEEQLTLGMEVSSKRSRMEGKKIWLERKHYKRLRG